jgi:HEAT repeat protein
MLGKLQVSSAVPVLVEGLRREEKLKSASWESGWLEMRPSLDEIRNYLIESQIYTLFALGSIGDNSAVPGVLEQTENQDSSVRRMAVYVLGALKDPSAIPRLNTMLNDVDEDVRWTAALSLAQLNNSDGAHLLMKLLDHGYVETLPEMTADQKAELRSNAIKGLALLKFEPAREKITALSQNDPVVAVRNASLEALKKF